LKLKIGIPNNEEIIKAINVRMNKRIQIEVKGHGFNGVVAPDEIRNS